MKNTICNVRTVRFAKLVTDGVFSFIERVTLTEVFSIFAIYQSTFNLLSASFFDAIIEPAISKIKSRSITLYMI